MASKSVLKSMVFGVVAIATVGVAQAVAGGVSGAGDCCFSHEAGGQTATSCLGFACASNEVCSGTGGVLPNGKPWAEAECALRPPEKINLPIIPMPA